MTQVIVLGDIHGQMAVFPRLDAVQRRYPDALTVFIGDYIDGHHQGFAALVEVRRRWLADAEHTVVLRGNHEQIMLDYLNDAEQNSWLVNQGAETMQAAVMQRFGRAGEPATNRQLLRAGYPGLLSWVETLPVEFALQHVRCVHAGYALGVSDPLAATPTTVKLWARGDYWYGGNREPVFAHNPLAATIVTGHTPTGHITGRFEGGLQPAKEMAPTHPVFTVAYPGEYARLFIDGGNHGGPARRCGNIVVIDSATGALVEKIQDPQ